MKKSSYIFKRLMQIIPMLLIVSALAFTLSNASSGDVAGIIARSRDMEPTEKNLELIRSELGLNAPLPVQYWEWLKRAARLDFGLSFQTKQPVFSEIASRYPATFNLALAATILSVAYAVPIALISVRYKDSAIDHFFRVVSSAGATIPDFWLGLMLLYLFGVQLGWVPVISGSKLQNILLPAFTLSSTYGMTNIRILRNNLLEVKNFDYIKAARARGLSESAALLKHGLKNSMLPMVTLIGINFGRLLGGSIACETIFSWNGIGKFAMDSIRFKDIPVIQGYILVVAITYILINLFMDVLYVYIDPKTKLD